jgi:hypothetical protein
VLTCTVFSTKLQLLKGGFSESNHKKIRNKIYPEQIETASTDEKLVEHFTCSSYHHGQARELKPKISLKKLNRDKLADLAAFNIESKELLSLGDQFNEQANKFNKYLTENCIPAGKGKSFAQYED